MGTVQIPGTSTGKDLLVLYFVSEACELLQAQVMI